MPRIFLSILIFACLPYRTSSQEYIYPFLNNGKIGFKDEKDSVVVIPVYDYYEAFEEGREWTVIGKGLYERLSNNATEREIRFKGKFGFINISGKEIFPPQFDVVFMTYKDHALVGLGEGFLTYDNWPEGKSITFSGKLGVINRHRYLSVPCDFRDIRPVLDGDQVYWFAMDETGRSFLYLDSIKLDTPPNITEISNFSEDLARIKVDGKFGFIDRSGMIRVPPVYDRAKDYSGGRAFVKSGHKYLWIDAKGLEIPDERAIVYDEQDNYSEGYARVRVFDEYGYLRPDSSFFIFPGFKEATPFFNHLASVSAEDSFGYVFTDGSKDIVVRYSDNKIQIPPGTFRPLQIPRDTFPVVNWDDTAYFFYPLDTLNLQKIISLHAEAMRWAPFLYFNYPQMLPKVSAGEGTMAARFLFNLPFLTPGNESWENLKRYVLLRILSDEMTRSLMWKLAKPYYRSSFQSMPALHQETYRELVDYLEGYYAQYDIETIRAFLSSNESLFAYEHPDGSASPFRKAGAQIDRLILVYEVITVEDVQKWIKKVKKEVSRW